MIVAFMENKTDNTIVLLCHRDVALGTVLDGIEKGDGVVGGVEHDKEAERLKRRRLVPPDRSKVGCA